MSERKWLKAELHAHTRDDPEDGGRLVRHSARDLIDEAARQGFEVLAITNHNQQLFNHHLSRYALDQGVLLLPGVEASLEGKHVLLYNFRQYSSAWRSFEPVERHKGPDSLVIAPHPFFPSPTALGRLLFQWRRIFDAVEYNHFYLDWLNFNRRAEAAASRLDLPMVGNSDVHHLFQLGSSYSLVYAEKTAEAVIDAIRNGNVRMATHAVSPWFMARWFLANGLQRGRFAVARLSAAVSGLPSRGFRPVLNRNREGG